MQMTLTWFKLKIVEVARRAELRSWKHKYKIPKAMNIDNVTKEIICPLIRQLFQM